MTTDLLMEKEGAAWGSIIFTRFIWELRANEGAKAVVMRLTQSTKEAPSFTDHISCNI